MRTVDKIRAEFPKNTELRLKDEVIDELKSELPVDTRVDSDWMVQSVYWDKVDNEPDSIFFTLYCPSRRRDDIMRWAEDVPLYHIRDNYIRIDNDTLQDKVNRKYTKIYNFKENDIKTDSDGILDVDQLVSCALSAYREAYFLALKGYYAYESKKEMELVEFLAKDAANIAHNRFHNIV